MNKNKLGVLIHGAGWVSTQHIEAYKKNPHTEILAISNRTEQNAVKRAKEAGIDVKIFTDLNEALKYPGIDIVSICTPQHLHADNVITAANAGKHIVIEKPACQTPEELRAMEEAVDKTGVKTIVSFVLRWNPLMQTVKRLIDDDSLGEISCVETDYYSYFGNWWKGFKEGRTRAMGGSSMLVAGCHAVDSLRWFAGQGEFEAAVPVEVFAYNGGKRKNSTWQYNPYTNDWADDEPLEYPGVEIALVKFSNGVLGKVSVNAECIKPYSFPIRVFGTKGTVFDNRLWSHKYPYQQDWIEMPVICPDSSDVSHHPFDGEINHFVECIMNDEESHCNLKDAALTHKIVFAMQESYKTGKPVRIEEQD